MKRENALKFALLGVDHDRPVFQRQFGASLGFRAISEYDKKQ